MITPTKEEYEAAMAKLNDPEYIKKRAAELAPPVQQFDSPMPQPPEFTDEMTPKEMSELTIKYQQDLVAWNDSKAEFYKNQDKQEHAKSKEKEYREKELATIAAFAKEHEDFDSLKEQVASYYNRGTPLDEAYRLARIDAAEKAKEEKASKIPHRTSARAVTDTDISTLREDVKGDLKKAATMAVEMHYKKENDEE